jgi:hypothetical protein
MVLLTAFFLLAGSVKVTGWQKQIFDIQLKFFISYGLNRQIMMLVGFVELFGVITMWLPNPLLSLVGTSSIIATSIGALFFHCRFDTWRDGIPAMITLLISSVITAINLQTISL